MKPNSINDDQLDPDNLAEARGVFWLLLLVGVCFVVAALAVGIDMVTGGQLFGGQ